LNKAASRFPPLIARLVPFGAVAVANGINLPYMRRDECFGKGMPLEDDDGNVVGHSPSLGKESIAKVVLSRILMATPTMVVPPVVVTQLQVQNNNLNVTRGTMVFSYFHTPKISLKMAAA
jgi:hypothetical protein